MNIFVLDRDPFRAAEMQCDKHVVKMVLETTQLLCSIFPEGSAPYKRTHYNHPCAKWARESSENYKWLKYHAFALAEEYTWRYGKVHKCLDVIRWCDESINLRYFDSYGLTEHPQCMPEEYKCDDVVQAYRIYYIIDKSRFAKWNKGRAAPEWWGI